MDKNIIDILDCLGEVESKLHITNYHLREANDKLRKMERKEKDFNKFVENTVKNIIGFL